MIAGIFIGGQSRRMGGSPKGLLSHPQGGSLLERLLDRVVSADLRAVFVGRNAAIEAAFPTIPALDDSSHSQGPLAGLRALMEHTCPSQCIVLASDMPFLSTELLIRLRDTVAPGAVLAPRSQSGRLAFEPFLARYDSTPTLAALADTSLRSFRVLWSVLHVHPFELKEDERLCLVDWDTPQDVHRFTPRG